MSLCDVTLSYVSKLNLLTALTENEFTYNSLIDKKRSHYGKNVALFAALHVYTAVRHELQSVEEFAAALHSSSVLC